MKLTQFKFFKKTPFTDFNNFLNFKNIKEALGYLDNFSSVSFSNEFNWYRDRSTLNIKPKIGENFDAYVNLNFGYYLDSDKNYHFVYVNNVNYVNDFTYKIEIIPNPIQTLITYNLLQKCLGYEIIEREHYEDKDDLKTALQQIRANDDTISTGSNDWIIHQDEYNFSTTKEDKLDSKMFSVVFETTSDLSADFGSEDDVIKMKTSTGQVRDMFVSARNLYIAKYDEFNKMLNDLKDYVWITRNIVKNAIIPSLFVDDDDLETATVNKTSAKIYKFKNNTINNNKDNIKSFSFAEIRQIYGLNSDGTQDYLLRYPYAYLEVLEPATGQSIKVKFEDFIDTDSIIFDTYTSIGYENQVAIFPRYYLSDGENKLNYFRRGQGLQNALVFKTFDSRNVLTDAYQTKLAENSYTRKLAQDKLITSRVKNVADTNANLQSRFMDGLSVASDFTVKGLQGKLTDEYEYYRTLNAEMNDAKASSPIETALGTTSNVFAIKNGIFGVLFKFHRVSQTNFNDVNRYHSMFGFKKGTYRKVRDFNMGLINYLKTPADYLTDRTNLNIANWEIELAKTQLSAGIKVWNTYTNGALLDKTKPFDVDIRENVLMK